MWVDVWMDGWMNPSIHPSMIDRSVHRSIKRSIDRSTDPSNPWSIHRPVDEGWNATLSHDGHKTTMECNLEARWNATLSQWLHLQLQPWATMEWFVFLCLVQLMYRAPERGCHKARKPNSSTRGRATLFDAGISTQRGAWYVVRICCFPPIRPDISEALRKKTLPYGF